MRNVGLLWSRMPWRSLLLAGAAVLLLCTAVFAAYSAIYPSATGDKTYKGGGATLDVSNAREGYIMVSMKSDKKVKVRVTGKQEYTYDLNADGTYEIYPLQNGSRKYKITVYEQVKGTSYAQALSKSIEVSLVNEYAAFLCPNRYTKYDANSRVVALGQEICKDLSTDTERAYAVYDYVSENILYDYILALTVKSGYVPDIDSTLDTKTGICFDYAAMICAMLRSQGIPTKMIIGYADTTYHAWNSVLLDGEWVHMDATARATFTEFAQYTKEAEY